MSIKYLTARGFDESSHVPFTREFKVGCSQCQAVAVNGTPVHERGCPNEVYECHGCDTLVPRNVRYCEDCR